MAATTNPPLYHIYFAPCRNKKLVKVGRTTDLQRRARELSFERGGRRKPFLATVPVLHKDAERVFHALLDPWRPKGRRLEYFLIGTRHIEWVIATWLQRGRELLTQCRRGKRHAATFWFHEIAGVQAPTDLLTESKRKEPTGARR